MCSLPLVDEPLDGLGELVGGGGGVFAEFLEICGQGGAAEEFAGDGEGLGAAFVIDDTGEGGVEGFIGAIGDGAEGDEGGAELLGLGAEEGGFHVDGQSAGAGEEGGLGGGGFDHGVGGVDAAAEDVGGELVGGEELGGVVEDYGGDGEVGV